MPVSGTEREDSVGSMATLGTDDIPEHVVQKSRSDSFYYGWVMLGVAILIHASSTPGQTFGLTSFNEPIRLELGLSHTSMTLAYMIASFLAAIPIPLIGAILDRFGARRTLLVVAGLLGCGCGVLSVARGILSLGSAFFLLRLSGQGALTLLATNTLAMWHRRRLGIAGGITGIGLACVAAVTPGICLTLIGEFGWRTAARSSGLFFFGLLTVITVFIYRNRPEDVGQVIDGGIQTEHSDPKNANSASNNSQRPLGEGNRDYDLRDSMKTAAFWIAMAASASWAMVGTAIVFHLIPLFGSRGLSETEATAVFPTFAISMAALQLVGGALADRVHLRNLLSISTGGMAGSIVILGLCTNVWQAHAQAAVFGASQGLLMVVNNVLWPRYYGLKHLGRIRGTIWMATMGGASIGPFIVGATLDQIGGYALALWIFGVLLGLISVASWFANPPVDHQLGKRSPQFD